MVSHGRFWAKLQRKSSHRKALLRNMVTSLMEHERIMTTMPKAKAAQKVAERFLGWAKLGASHRMARAYVQSVLYKPQLMDKVFNTIAPRYANRNGGFTRVMRVKFRQGDNAEMAYLELVDRAGELRKPTAVTEEMQRQFEKLSMKNHEQQMKLYRSIPPNGKPLSILMKNNEVVDEEKSKKSTDTTH